MKYNAGQLARFNSLEIKSLGQFFFFHQQTKSFEFCLSVKTYQTAKSNWHHWETARSTVLLLEKHDKGEKNIINYFEKHYDPKEKSTKAKC